MTHPVLPLRHLSLSYSLSYWYSKRLNKGLPGDGLLGRLENHFILFEIHLGGTVYEAAGFSNGRLPLENGSDRRETVRKRVSDDSRHFIFRRRKQKKNAEL